MNGLSMYVVLKPANRWLVIFQPQNFIHNEELDHRGRDIAADFTGKMFKQFLAGLLKTTPKPTYSMCSARLCSGTKQNIAVNNEEDDKLYQKLELELRAHDNCILESYHKFVDMAAQHLDLTIGKSDTRKQHDHLRMTILRSNFVHKKHREQYEFRTYYKFLNFYRLTGSTLSTFLEYIERNLPEGVHLKATKVELLKLPEHLKPPKIDK